MTIADKREQIQRSLSDPDYRHQFVEEEINVGLAFQIKSLRDRQKLTQMDLAKKLKVKQPLVSAWESPAYGKYNLRTLKELAKAFDVGLSVRFVSFRTLTDLTVNLTSDLIAPPNYVDDDKGNNTIKIGPIKVTSADNMSDFINTLIPGTFLSTAENTPKGEELCVKS